MRMTFLIALLFSAALSAQTLTLHYNFSNQWADDEWTGEWRKVPGHPSIPQVTVKILLPYHQDILSWEFIPDDLESLKTFDFPIAPYPVAMCNGTNFRYPRERAQKFPITHAGRISVVEKYGYRIAYIPLYPVRYVQASGRGYTISGAQIRLQLRQAAASSFYRGFRRDQEDVERMVGTPANFSSYPLTLATAKVDYFVIGPKSLLEDADANSIGTLLAEKNQRGVVTALQTVEEITAKYPGKDNQEKIRNAIIDRYKTDGIRYVLLVGNGYSSVPTRILHVNVSEGSIPSDLYYACVSAKFTSNESNLACEVAVGRAPVSNLNELHAFVSKTLKMTSLQNSDPRALNALMFAEKLDGETLGSKLIHQLVTGGSAGSLKTQGYPSTYNIQQMYETFSNQFTDTEVLNALNEGNFYTVNHLGHANESYCMEFMDTSISKLTNPLPFFGITQGCHPGDLNGPNWASKMVVHASGGAGAMVANSNYGFYDGGGSSDGPSNHYHLAFYDAVFRDQIRNLGLAHYRAKEKLIPEVMTDEIIRWVVYETNLLGDPELALRFL